MSAHFVNMLRMNVVLRNYMFLLNYMNMMQEIKDIIDNY